MPATSACARNDSSTWPKRWALAVPELGDQRAQPLQLGAHLRPHLVEPGVDDVLLRRQVGLHADGAAEPSCSRLSTADLLERGPHRGVALGRRPGRQLGQRRGEGLVDGVVDALRPRRRRAGRTAGGRPRRRRPRRAPPPASTEEHVHHQHAAMMPEGCHSAADPPVNWGDGLTDSGVVPRRQPGRPVGGPPRRRAGAACSPATGAASSTTTARSCATTAARLWITCRTEFRGWRHPLDAPRVWTPLFFLDDAVALAAGHRPCATVPPRRLPRLPGRGRPGRQVGPSRSGGRARPAAGRRTPAAGTGSRPRRRPAVCGRPPIGELPAGTVIVDDERRPRLARSTTGRCSRSRSTAGPIRAGRPRRRRRSTVLTPPTSVAALRRRATARRSTRRRRAARRPGRADQPLAPPVKFHDARCSAGAVQRGVVAE